VIEAHRSAHYRRMVRVFISAVALASAACAVGTASGNKSFNSDDSDGGSFTLDGGSTAQGALIYAHSDTELYSMDPTTQAINDIGPFTTGSKSAPVITDLAVDGEGNVWVNSESAIYTAAIPASGSGNVELTLVANIAVKSIQNFYALAFAPAGVLGTNEMLVAGDNLGVLYAIDTSGQTTELGAFGNDNSGDAYELSGDIVFYTQSGTARGLATIRSCSKSGTCSGTDDILAEIDVPAMQAAFQNHSPASSLKKQLLGGGTGYGHLYGVGAWNDSVFAFSRSSGSTPAQLVVINATGVGSVVKTFGEISGGWSGAGVTTKAPISIIPN